MSPEAARLASLLVVAWLTALLMALAFVVAIWLSLHDQPEPESA